MSSYRDKNSHWYVTLNRGTLYEPSLVVYDSGDSFVGTKASEHIKDISQQDTSHNIRVVESFKPLLSLPSWGSVRWRRLKSPLVFKPDHRTTDAMIRARDDAWVAEGTSRDARVPRYTPNEVDQSTLTVLKYLKQRADEVTGLPQEDGAVIGLPVNFPVTGQARLRRLAVQAGLAKRPRDVRFVLEPLAVVFRYGVDQSKDRSRILVFDLGGGTLDLSVVDIDPHRLSDRFRVLSHKSCKVGGIDFDSDLLKFLSNAYSLPVPENQDSADYYRLMESIRQIKEALSEASSTTFNFAVPGKVYTATVDREDFEKAIQEHLEKIRETLSSLLREVDPKTIDRVLMAGGSSVVPAVKDTVRSFFPDTPINDDYAGPGLSCPGYGLAGIHLNELKDITDVEYCVWDIKNAVPVTVVPSGIPLDDMSNHNRLIINPDSPEMETSVLVFSRDGERYFPVCKVLVPPGKSSFELSGRVDPATRELKVSVSDAAGNQIQAQSIDWTGSPSDPPSVIWAGQLIKAECLKGPLTPPYGIVETLYPRWGVPNSNMGVIYSQRYRLIAKTLNYAQVDIDLSKDKVYLHDVLPKIGEILDVSALRDDDFVELRIPSNSQVYSVSIRQPALQTTRAARKDGLVPGGRDAASKRQGEAEILSDIESVVGELEFKYLTLEESLPPHYSKGVDLLMRLASLRQHTEAALKLDIPREVRMEILAIQQSIENAVVQVVRLISSSTTSSQNESAELEVAVSADETQNPETGPSQNAHNGT